MGAARLGALMHIPVRGADQSHPQPVWSSPRRSPMRWRFRAPSRAVTPAGRWSSSTGPRTAC